MPKSSLEKKRNDNIKPIAARDKEIHAFSKTIHLKVNVLVSDWVLSTMILLDIMIGKN